MAILTTIKEIGQILDLSPSTISKALNDSPEISLRTKKRVKETALAFGYVPNHSAQSLKSKKTKLIGVVLPNVIDVFFAKVLHGIALEASKLDYNLVVNFSNDSKENEEKIVWDMINHNVDGVLISFSKETQKSIDYKGIRKLDNYDVPVVMLDRTHKELKYDSVTINDFSGSYDATWHLLSTGCKKVAFLSPISNTSVGNSRKMGYIAALKDFKNGHQPFCIEFGSYDNFKGLIETTFEVNGFDGVLAADEKSAVYALTTLQRLNYKIPEQISIIGFTDGPMSEISNPPLSVVSQHAEDMGKKSFLQLMNRLDQPKLKRREVVLKPELIKRGTTK